MEVILCNFTDVKSPPNHDDVTDKRMANSEKRLYFISVTKRQRRYL